MASLTFPRVLFPIRIFSLNLSEPCFTATPAETASAQEKHTCPKTIPIEKESPSSTAASLFTTPAAGLTGFQDFSAEDPMRILPGSLTLSAEETLRSNSEDPSARRPFISPRVPLFPPPRISVFRQRTTETVLIRWESFRLSSVPPTEGQVPRNSRKDLTISFAPSRIRERNPEDSISLSSKK